jgi:energy-coupling factor transport system ATP-binding protein
MPSVIAKIRLAIYLAIGFVLFRLLYAFIFTGASAGNPLIDLGGVRLSGIFSHVLLFGPLGDVGLARAIQSALPFAAGILILGSLSALIPTAKIVSFARTSGSGLLAALAIGLATLPNLLEAARRISRANKLRSENRFSILIPLLETALERAGIFAARFAMGGPGSRAKSDSVLVSNLEVPGVFSSVNLELSPGDVVVISGPTGSGKTTLLETIVGITKLKTGRASVGDISVFGLKPELDVYQLGGLVGYLPQQPRSWFVSDRVSAELAEPSLPWAKFGVEEVDLLSEGQAVKLGISNALSHDPKLVILDEPFAALDLEAAKELNELIGQWSQAGKIVVIAEHQLNQITHKGARLLTLNGTLSKGEYLPNATQTPRIMPIAPNQLITTKSIPQIRDLKLPEAISIHQSERIALLGSNGVGKTSLLNYLESTLDRCRMVPERVEDFFVTQSLAQELEGADRLSKVPKGFTKLSLESMIPLSEPLLRTHPRDLSAGTKLALAIAMQLSYKPEILLIDEPVKGLDPIAREKTAEVLACVAETGCAVIFATHDEQFARSANTQIRISGVLV